MNKKRILIVDDEQLVLKSLEVNLSREHFNVHSAATVEQALDLVQQQHFDIILSDYHLGRLTGMDLLEQVKKINPVTKFIIFSGHDDQILIDEILSEGAALFLAKPFNLDDILEGIKSL